jgi:hypothetical protein
MKTAKQPLTFKKLRAAKKLFTKQPRATRAFTSVDYNNLPKGYANA